MKKILGILMTFAVTVSMVIGMSIVSFAEDDVPNQPSYSIGTAEEFIDFMASGACEGRAILNNNIIIHRDLRFEKDVYIDLNGYSLTILGEGTDYSVSVNFILYNTNKSKRGKVRILPNFKGEKGELRINGNFAIKDADAQIEDYINQGRVIRCNANISGALIKNSGLIANFDGVKGLMTDEQFKVAVMTGNLPTLEREGFDFGGWSFGGEAVSSINGLTGENPIKAVWKSRVKVTFDANGGKCDVTVANPDNELCFTELPYVEKEGFCFDGWFTEDGRHVTTSTQFASDTTVKAEWVDEADKADGLSTYLSEQGYSKTRINQIINLFGGSGVAASAIASGNIWIIISCVLAVLLIGAIAALVVVKKKSEK